MEDWLSACIGCVDTDDFIRIKNALFSHSLILSLILFKVYFSSFNAYTANCSAYYENMSVQYAAISKSGKNDNF